MHELKFRAWDKKYNVMRGLNGVTDFFQIRNDGKCNDDYIVMLFTGIKNKNGTEIYEGDIVELNKRKFVVEKTISKEYGFRITVRDLYYKDLSITFCWSDCTVIGNIYENPELIEKENE